MNESEAAEAILALEREGLRRWAQGDPDGFLELSAPDVTYFDPFVERRLDGLEALRELYERLRGQVHIDRFELGDPKVQFAGDAAILTFQFEGWSGAQCTSWNTTEVYRRHAGGWRIVHTHWAFHRPVADEE